MTTQHRPRETAAPPGAAGQVSAADITQPLPATAQRILDSALRVLRREGYGGLTLRRIAEEAGEHKSLVIYHFGTKATLMSMLVDSLWHDLDVELFHSVERLPQLSHLRVSALIDSQRRLGHLVEKQQMYVELFGSLTRQADARRQLGALNASYRDLHRRCLEATGLPADELAALSGLVLAVGDGMAVSLLVRRDEIDDAGIYALLEKMVLALADSAGRRAAGSAAVTRRRPPAPARAATAAALVGRDPLDGLAPVARKLVHGARHVLLKRGFQALTLEAVGREAGEPASAITYYFGDKQGLVAALIQAQLHAQREAGARLFSAPRSAGSCSDGAICAARELLSDMSSFRAFYDLLPVVTRDPAFRELQAAHDRWLVGLIAGGLADDLPPDVAASADPLAVMSLAAADGLAMQVLCDPSGFDPAPCCALLERMMSDLGPT